MRTVAASTTIGPGNVISANGREGIRLTTGGHTVIGNIISANPAGTSSSGFTNGQPSIRVDGGSGTLIGGTTSTARNVIGLSGDGTAINITSSSATATTVQGNYIGVNASGTGVLNSSPAAGSAGILINSSSTNNIIGGSASGAGNVIGGTAAGIELTGSSTTGTQIKGNSIGVGVGGADVGNASQGIWVLSGPTSTQIGGTGSGEGNQIDYNGTYGIQIVSSSNNTVAGNDVSANGIGGVRIEQSTGVKVTQTTTSNNSNGDGISLLSANNGISAPSNLSFANVNSTPKLSGNSCANCVVEIFTNDTRDDGEGPHYLTAVTADSSGAFTADVTGCSEFMTATSRSSSTNDTSIFTKPMVDAGNGCETPTPHVQLGAASPASQTIAPGATAYYHHTLTNSGTASGSFTIARTSTQSGWTIQHSPAGPLTLAAGASATIYVTVTVPLGAAAGLNDQTNITATVSGESAQRSDSTTVQQVRGVNIEPPRNGSVTAGSSAVTIDYTHYITNTGNSQDTITLTTSSSSSGASAAVLSGNTCTLNAGQACTKTVRVTIPANSSAAYDDTTVTATASGAASDSVVDRTNITQVALPQISSGTTQNVQPPASGTVSVQFVHTVKNIGGQTGTFTLSESHSPTLSGWSFALASPTSFSLAPQATRLVTLTVTVPSTAQVGDDVTTAVKLTAPSGAAVTASDVVHILLAPGLSFSPAKVPTVNAAPAQVVSFTHTLTNTGNGSDSFTFVLTATSGLTDVSINPTSATLAHNQSTKVVVSARVSNGTAASPPLQTIGVTAQRTSSPLLSVLRVDSVSVVGAAVPQISAAQTQTATLPLPSTRVFTHTLTNIGNIAGSFTLVASASGGLGATASTPSCLTNLAANATCQFTVQVNVPAESIAGPYAISIKATADTSTSVKDTLIVPPDPGLLLTPSYPSGTADPGEVFTYTHTLTNTGNVTDSFAIDLDISDGWSALASPVIVANVPPKGVRTLAIVVTAPEGVPAGSTGSITVTATSAFDPFPAKQVIDTTSINAKPGARLIPQQQTLSANPTKTLSDTVIFMHTLRNSGSIPLSYTITWATAPIDWTTYVTPTQVGPLEPGAEAPISVTVTVPANTTNGEVTTTTLHIQQFGDTSADLTTGYDKTVAGPQYGALLTPQVNSKLALPGETVAYTHTLSNNSAYTDTFLLTTIAPNGWDTRVAPSALTLKGRGSTTITVTVRVPTSALSSTLDVATLRAQSVTDSSAVGTAQEKTTVRQVVDVSLSPPRTRQVSAGQTVTLLHNLTNLGNGVDYFDLSATITGTDVISWPVTISPEWIRLASGEVYPVVQVVVKVPDDMSPNALGRITVVARSRSEPSIEGKLEDTIGAPGQVANTGSTTYLPIVMR